MCGFAGILDLDPREDEATRKAAVQAMGRRLSHRGPDDETVYVDSSLALVFRRLSIIDLPGGKQPIWNEDRTVVAVVNGEIYNYDRLRAGLERTHTFSTRSDSEVVVHLYEDKGPELLLALRGMFAIAVWDRVAKRLFLARDRLGIKPLYLCQIGSRLLFASELKALVAHPDCPTELQWSDLHHIDKGVLPTPTYVKGISHLEGGHYVMVQPGQSYTPQRYWTVSDSFSTDATDERDLIAQGREYSALLEDAVTSHLMSDVPVGAFLSGGLDSSLIVALAAKRGKTIHCFHVLSQSVFLSGDSHRAEALAKHLGQPFHPVLFDERKVLAELDFSLPQFERLVWTMDRPAFGLEWLLKNELHRYAKTQIPDLKVMLLGQGADEFAGGYSGMLGTGQGSWQKYLDGEVTNEMSAAATIDKDIPSRLLPLMGKGQLQMTAVAGQLHPYQWEMLRRSALLQQYNLWHEDRTSSAWGIESRVPFLDHPLVEFLASIPPHHYPKLFWDKSIVRQAAVPWLPEALRTQTKVGFYVSGVMMLVGRLLVELANRVFPAFRDEYLHGPDSIFDATEVEALYGRIQSGIRATKTAYELLEVMAIAIFERQCRTAKTDLRFPASTGSPLRAAPHISEDLWR